MKKTTIDSSVFFISEADLAQAERLIPSKDYGILTICGNLFSTNKKERIAYAIYKKSAYPRPNNEFGRVKLALQLQWMYDHAEDLQVIE